MTFAEQVLEMMRAARDHEDRDADAAALLMDAAANMAVSAGLSPEVLVDRFRRTVVTAEASREMIATGQMRTS